MNKEGAISGILVGLIFTFGYIVYFCIWWIKEIIYGELPQLVLEQLFIPFNCCIHCIKNDSSSSKEVQDLVERIRIPSGAGEALDH